MGSEAKENLKIASDNIEILTIQVKLIAQATKEMSENLERFLNIFPEVCPNCGFSHETNLWKWSSGDAYCSMCNYALQDKDCWFDEFEN